MNEPLCDSCKGNTAQIFQDIGQYCLDCWQKLTYPEVWSKKR